jgi:hypothetical protein
MTGNAKKLTIIIENDGYEDDATLTYTFEGDLAVRLRWEASRSEYAVAPGGSNLSLSLFAGGRVE